MSEPRMTTGDISVLCQKPEQLHHMGVVQFAESFWGGKLIVYSEGGKEAVDTIQKPITNGLIVAVSAYLERHNYLLSNTTISPKKRIVGVNPDSITGDIYHVMR
jgi:hypothetical protein